MLDTGETKRKKVERERGGEASEKKYGEIMHGT